MFISSNRRQGSIVEDSHNQNSVVSSNKLMSVLKEKSRQKEPRGQEIYSTLPTILGSPDLNLNQRNCFPNSTRVHQRASAGDHLAAASVPTALSLPLMIGNRSKCVVNLLDNQQVESSNAKRIVDTNNSQHQTTQTNLPKQQIMSDGPQNTAQRAEQRRANTSISVVRPVINTTISDVEHHGESRRSSGIIDEWMNTDMHISAPIDRSLVMVDNFRINKMFMDDFDRPKVDYEENFSSSSARQFIRSEQETRQQLHLLKREEHELNRNIRRQHNFIHTKLEERKRNLQIIQAVWFQKDFKSAIERLVDLYHQGLIFTTGESGVGSSKARHSHRLNSLNTSLVVDVVAVIMLKPKLWSLEICKLLLPIIINDLLMQTNYDYYVEVGLKSITMIVTHFSSVIKTTLDTLSLETKGNNIGVDLSREDRQNKCLICYRYLLEARALIAARNRNLKLVKDQHARSDHRNNSCKLITLYGELESMLNSLESSVEMDPYVMARRLRANGISNH